MSITSTVTSKGQVTLPAPIRKAFKIGTLNRRVRFELCKDGSARIYPVADALSLKGVFHDPSHPYDPEEREKAWAAHSKEVVRKGHR
jgi:bifunctional DNA-binding transcriptional regulator/antitoxin component of YhaV-PrlF toxin-antitoxin module